MWTRTEKAKYCEWLGVSFDAIEARFDALFNEAYSDSEDCDEFYTYLDTLVKMEYHKSQTRHAIKASNNF